MKLFIGCSCYNDISTKYIDDCKVLLEEIFKKEYVLVFGASAEGIMGLCYDVARKNDCNILGIYPEKYREYADFVECEKIEVLSVSERTTTIIKESDVLLFLPGGIGTFYELFTAIESKRGLEHNKKIILYNSCGYYDKLLECLEFMKDELFIDKKVLDNIFICNDIDKVLEYLNKDI